MAESSLEGLRIAASCDVPTLLRNLIKFASADAVPEDLQYCKSISRLQEHSTYLNGNRGLIRRVYAHMDELGSYSKIGWVVSGDINHCMICMGGFSTMKLKHFCHSCGNIVCGRCSPSTVIIKELAFAGHLRVCCQCDIGQVSSEFLHSSYF